MLIVIKLIALIVVTLFALEADFKVAAPVVRGQGLCRLPRLKKKVLS
jgi:hypothetical protein